MKLSQKLNLKQFGIKKKQTFNKIYTISFFFFFEFGFFFASCEKFKGKSVKLELKKICCAFAKKIKKLYLKKLHTFINNNHVIAIHA